MKKYNKIKRNLGRTFYIVAVITMLAGCDHTASSSPNDKPLMFPLPDERNKA